MQRRHAMWGILTFGMFLVATGCSSSAVPGGGADAPTVADDLFEVGGLLKDHTATYKRGPTKLADMAGNQPLYPRGYAAVQNGSIVVIWGIPVTEEGTGQRVVAYEKKTETEGGSVLLENGTIKTMTADEFKAAPKASK